MGNELSRMDPNAELEFDWRQAKALAASGLFPDARSAEQALAKIRFGRDLGLNATQAMTGVHIVKGKPQVAAVTLAAFVRESGRYDFRVLEHTSEVCRIEFGPVGAPGRDESGGWLPWPQAFGVSEFSMKDARAADLVKPDSGWAKFPRNMLYARAMSNGVKWFCPDATHGIPVYHEGEIEEPRMMDAAVMVEQPAAVSLSSVMEQVPAELRDRLWDAYKEACELRSPPGVAAVRMAVVGQPDSRVEAFIRSLEDANAQARATAGDVVDADVVLEERDTSGLDRQIADLRGRRAELEDNQTVPPDETVDAELAQIDGEIERLERERHAASDGSQGVLL